MSFLKKEKEFYKEKCGTVKKIKSVKNVIIEKVSWLHTKVFQVCVSIVKDSFLWNLSLALVLVLQCYCADKNTDFFQNTCFKENGNMAVEKISQ